MGANAGRQALADRVAGRLDAAGVGPGAGIVAAVSGGSDSVALLRLLVELGGPLALTVTAAHLHHGLRGAAADGDRAFVADLCRRLGVDLVEGDADVRAEARAAGVSLEMAARAARRRFLERARQTSGARFIALGHQVEDQAETLLLRLGRGAGMMGAGAMKASGAGEAGEVVRPLLGEERKTLRTYLLGLDQDWREDESNAELWAERNRLRLAVLPTWEAAHPGVSAALARSAGHLRDDGELLAAAVESLLPAAVRDNGGPWRPIPWSLWSLSHAALRRQLLRQAAWSLCGVYPPTLWTAAWARWPEAREARPDLTWLRVGRTGEAVIVFRPAVAATIALPAGATPWRLALPDDSVLEAAPSPGAATDRRAVLGDGAVVRHPWPGERGADGALVRESLRRRRVPAPCREGAWLVAGDHGSWLPAGGEARCTVTLAEGAALELVWRAAPVHLGRGGWPVDR